MRFQPLLLVLFSTLAACAAPTGDDDNAVAGDPANQTGTKVLLDCNVFESGGGPDQQVTVIQKNGALVLRELTNSGGTEERPLSAEEWAKKDIKLRHDRFDSESAVNRVWKEGGDWLNESKDSGFSTFGSADCFTDKSK